LSMSMLLIRILDGGQGGVFCNVEVAVEPALIAVQEATPSGGCTTYALVESARGADLLCRIHLLEVLGCRGLEVAATKPTLAAAKALGGVAAAQSAQDQKSRHHECGERCQNEPPDEIRRTQFAQSSLLIR